MQRRYPVQRGELLFWWQPLLPEEHDRVWRQVRRYACALRSASLGLGRLGSRPRAFPPFPLIRRPLCCLFGTGVVRTTRPAGPRTSEPRARCALLRRASQHLACPRSLSDPSCVLPCRLASDVSLRSPLNPPDLTAHPAGACQQGNSLAVAPYARPAPLAALARAAPRDPCASRTANAALAWLAAQTVARRATSAQWATCAAR
jgi:hypothetical protein